MDFKEIIKNIAFGFGYGGFSYIIYIWFRMTCELNIKFEAKKQEKTFPYLIKNAFLHLASVITLVLMWCAIVPCVIYLIDSYFEKKLLNRYQIETRGV